MLRTRSTCRGSLWLAWVKEKVLTSPLRRSSSGGRTAAHGRTRAECGKQMGFPRARISVRWCVAVYQWKRQRQRHGLLENPKKTKGRMRKRAFCTTTAKEVLESRKPAGNGESSATNMRSVDAQRGTRRGDQKTNRD